MNSQQLALLEPGPRSKTLTLDSETKRIGRLNVERARYILKVTAERQGDSEEFNI
jgi:hypothetical protein